MELMKRKMPGLRLALIFFVGISLTACKDDATSKIAEDGYSLESEGTAYPRNTQISLQLNGEQPDSVVVETPGDARYSPSDQSLNVRFETTGLHAVKLLVYKHGKHTEASARLHIFGAQPARQLTYRVVAAVPHTARAYTQGLEFAGENLYESRGQYGESKIERFSKDLTDPEKSHTLPSNAFGEGLTVAEDKIYQLTWRAKKVYVYNRDLQLQEELDYPLSEGWGICHDGRKLWVSDGSNRLHLVDENMQVLDIRDIYNGREALNQLNELEFADGKIWANAYQTTRIYRINPKTGEAEAYLDLAALRQQLTNPRAEVLNGIAWHPGRQQLLVTGKYWDKAFWIEVEE